MSPAGAGAVPDLAELDPRFVSALAPVASAGGRPDAFVPDSILPTLRAGRKGQARWFGYSEMGRRRSGWLLAYGAEFHRLPAAVRAELFRAWTPVTGNEACVLWLRGETPPAKLAAADPALRHLAAFVARLEQLRRGDGVHRSSTGALFRCRRAGSDLGAVEEAAAAYRPAFEALGPGSIVVDVGAHVGGFAIPAARKATRGRVVAFEPDPASRRALRENLALNALERVEVRAEALSSRDGSGTLHQCRANPVLSSLARAYGGSERIRVRLASLASAFATLGLERVDLLKVDVEGAEYDILLACPDLLARRVGSLLVEAHARAGRDPEQLVGFLERLGFAVERGGHGPQSLLWAWRRA